MTSSNGARPEDNQAQPAPRTPSTSPQLSPEVEAVLTALIDQRLNAVLAQAIPQIAEGVMSQLSQGAQSQQNGVQQAAPQQNSFFGNLLSNPETLFNIIDKGLDKWLAFKQVSAQTNIDVNPLATLGYIQQKYPLLLSLHAPNPLGEGFQQIFTGAFLKGMQVGASSKGVTISAPLAPPSISPIVSPTLGPSVGSTNEPVAVLSEQEKQWLRKMLDDQPEPPYNNSQRDRLVLASLL